MLPFICRSCSTAVCGRTGTASDFCVSARRCWQPPAYNHCPDPPEPRAGPRCGLHRCRHADAGSSSAQRGLRGQKGGEEGARTGRATAPRGMRERVRLRARGAETHAARRHGISDDDASSSSSSLPDESVDLAAKTSRASSASLSISSRIVSCLRFRSAARRAYR